MQGESANDADPLELDYTEILVLQAGTEAALAAIDVATAYILSPNPLGAQGFVEALTPGSTFLTLAAGGGDALGDALERIQSAGTLLLSAFDALEAETDDQSDDIIEIDAVDLADARAVVQDIKDALSSPTVVTFDEGDEDEYSFTLDARKFFVDPITDLKELLAPYEVFTAVEGSETVGVFRWTALNLDEWVLPDPTFNGILPEMNTTSDLFDLGFDEFFFDFSLTMGYFDLITLDGLDCRADFEGGGSGCAFGGDFIYGGAIDLSGYDGESMVYFNLHGQMSGVFSDGTYDVVDNMDGTYMVNMDMVMQDGSNTALMLVGTLTDMPGYTSVDELFRRRGGSTLEVTYMGSVLLFENQGY